MLNEGEFVTLDGDLAGFWDMVYLQIEDIQRMFKQLDEMRTNNWTMPKPLAPAKKTPVKSTINQKRGESMPTPKANATAKARADAARQRLIEAKKIAAAAAHLSKQTEQIDSPAAVDSVDTITPSSN